MDTPRPESEGVVMDTPRLPVIVKGTGYVPIVHPRKPQEAQADRMRRIESGLRYAIAYLAQPSPDGADDPGRALFGPTTRDGDPDAARATVRAHLGRRAAFHRVMLSPHGALDLTSVDEMIDWTRAVMDTTQRRVAQEWAWVGGIHSNTRTRHAHVVIAGGALRGANDVTMTHGLFAHMRQAGVRAASDVAAQRTRRYDRIYRMGV